MEAKSGSEESSFRKYLNAKSIPEFIVKQAMSFSGVNAAVTKLPPSGTLLTYPSFPIILIVVGDSDVL
jgi:hypothetical protein